MKKFEKFKQECQEEIGAALGKLLVAVALVGVAVLVVVPGKMLVATVAAQEKVDVAVLQAFTGGVAERSDGLSLATLTIAETFAGGEDHSV